MINQEEKQILRELAKQYKEIALNEVNLERQKRMSNTNDLVTGLRPSVLIHEVPWHEMNIDGQLNLLCKDSFAIEMERHFRTTLLRWKYFQADMVVENFYRLAKSWSCSGNGLSVKENIVKTDDDNNIISHEYIDELDTEEKVDKILEPIVTVDKEADKINSDQANDILNGILDVRLTGTQIYCAPWDHISRYRGVEPILIDMMDRPEFVHKIIKKFMDNESSLMTQLEAFDLLDAYPSELHCTPAYTSQLPQKDFDGKTRLKDVWFRGMAQMFSTISPAMHDEFDLQYMRPLMERCGLSYYGCCEPLDDKIINLKKIPNMRKIGVSPWAGLESCAEQIGDKYVYARKPNPAFVADNLDASTIEKEIEETIKICIKYNCPYEFVLKDISTVSYKPQNLTNWNNIVQKTIDKFYK